MRRLYNHHRVAEGEKTIPLINRGFINVQNLLSSAHCRNKHYERAFGEVEIRYQCVDALEFIRRIYKNLCVSAALF